MQMIGWREDFCERLASRGFFVVRFDNRDVGRSTRLDDLPVPTFWQLAQRDKRAASYTLEDMATDVVGLLDHLEIEPSPCGRCVDGGDDRPDGRGQLSRPRPLARLDHGQHRRPLVRSAAVADGEGADERPTGGSRRFRGSHDEDVHGHRLARVRARRGRSPAVRRGDLRPRAQSGCHRSPARRDQCLRGPHASVAPDQRSDVGHPWQRRHARSALRRPCDRQGDRGLDAPRDPGDGARPPTRGLAGDRRRHCQERGPRSGRSA